MATTRRIITDAWFWHTLTYNHRGRPWIEHGTTHETDHPYRSATPVVVRIPWTKTALVIGRWGPSQPEEQALLAAVGGSYRSLEELDVH